MSIEFDQAKSDSNQRKHGVPLTFAAMIDRPAVRCFVDDRKDYGELREIGYAPINGRLYCVVFTQRDISFRVISLRKASNREIERYEQADEIDP